MLTVLERESYLDLCFKHLQREAATAENYQSYGRQEDG